MLIRFPLLTLTLLPSILNPLLNIFIALKCHFLLLKVFLLILHLFIKTDTKIQYFWHIRFDPLNFLAQLILIILMPRVLQLFRYKPLSFLLEVDRIILSWLINGHHFDLPPLENLRQLQPRVFDLVQVRLVPLSVEFVEK